MRRRGASLWIGTVSGSDFGAGLRIGFALDRGFVPGFGSG